MESGEEKKKHKRETDNREREREREREKIEVLLSAKANSPSRDTKSYRDHHSINTKRLYIGTRKRCVTKRMIIDIGEQLI